MDSLTQKEDAVRKELKRLRQQNEEEQKKMKMILKQEARERDAKEKADAKKRKEERKMKILKEQAEAKARKAEKLAIYKAEVERLRIEKQQIKEEKRALRLKREEQETKASIQRLQREVVVEFDPKALVPNLEAVMGKYGEIEYSRCSPVGLQIRYKTLAAAQKALKSQRIISKMPSNIIPAQIRHHAVHFEAPEDMGELDQELLSQVEMVMRAYGHIVSTKKKGRYIVVFFDNVASAKNLTSNDGNEVTIEIGGHNVALVAGIPPTAQQRRKRMKAEKMRQLNDQGHAKMQKMEH